MTASARAGSAGAPASPTGPRADPPPTALVADVRNKPRVVALSREAERRGVARGMTLAEARALSADLVALPCDGERLARAALEVTTALLAASPRVAWAGDTTVPLRPRAPVSLAGRGEAGLWWVDAAGLGSEAKLARRLARIAGDLGFGRARVGIADSAIAAYAATFSGHRGTGAQGHGRTAAAGERRTRWRAEASTDGAQPGAPPGPRKHKAAARPQHVPADGPSPPRARDALPAHQPLIVSPGDDAAFLAPFPLALLEPDEDLADTCHALGLRTVGQFAALDADEVEARFGPGGLTLHRLARGLDMRGPSTPRDDALPIVACDLGSPVGTSEPLLFVLKGALASLGSALRAKGLAAREVALTLTLDDGSTAEKAVRPARPTSHEGALFDHCRAAFEDWALPEPVVALAVRAAVTVPASGEQGDLLAPRWADPATLAAAFDRIRGSEGADAVARPVALDAHLPQDAGTWSTDGRSPPRSRDAAPDVTLRPPADPPAQSAALRLLQPPAPIRVRLGRAGLETFRHGEAWHDVTAWSGPERLVPRWWVAATGPIDGEAAHSAGAPAGPRDYYSARTTDGALWLLFRACASRRWFVEGWWD